MGQATAIARLLRIAFFAYIRQVFKQPGRSLTMFLYPARLSADEAGVTVTFRDIPEALTSGTTREEAIEMAAAALALAMDFYFEDKRPVPLPSTARRGETLIAIPASLSAKVLLLNEMIAQQVT
jgi:antitoxin HicB